MFRKFLVNNLKKLKLTKSSDVLSQKNIDISYRRFVPNPLRPLNISSIISYVY